MKNTKDKKMAISILAALTVVSACFLVVQISAFIDISTAISSERELEHIAETPPPGTTPNQNENGPNNASTSKESKFSTTTTQREYSEEELADIARRKAMIPTNPYRILQKGMPRTGTTFQFQLLQGIVSLKIPGQELLSGFLGERPGMLKEAFATNKPFVFKTHGDEFDPLCKNGTAAMFSTGGFTDRNLSVYMQSLRNIRKCPTCEVRAYQPLFDLTDKQVHDLEQHMENFGILRRCCSLQMSRFEMFRLHNCPVEPYKKRPDYPHCEKYNLREIEEQMATSPIPFQPNDPNLNWVKPGDCNRYRNRIRSGEAFNGCEFQGCTLQGILGMRNCTKTDFAKTYLGEGK